MNQMKFSANILDYLGKYEDGVLVLLSIQYESSFYDSTYYYNSEHLLLTISDELEMELGGTITQDPDYPDLIRYIIKKTIPYEEIFNRLDVYDHK